MCFAVCCGSSTPPPSHDRKANINYHLQKTVGDLVCGCLFGLLFISAISLYGSRIYGLQYVEVTLYGVIAIANLLKMIYHVKELCHYYSLPSYQGAPLYFGVQQPHLQQGSVFI